MDQQAEGAAMILEHVAQAQRELASAQALFARSVAATELFGGQPLGDFNEAVRRLSWFTCAASGRVEKGRKPTMHESPRAQ